MHNSIKMKSLLWYQSPQEDQEDVILVDGVALDTGDAKRNEAFASLMNVANKVLKHPTPWCGFVKGIFFMKGYLNIKDQYGRMTAFMFATKSKNYKRVLGSALLTLGFRMDRTSVAVLRKAESKTIKKVLVAIAVITLIILISLIAYGRE